MLWVETHKGDQRGRALADRHYTRQSPGDVQWTRPGWNMVLIAQQATKPERRAVFVWWRPKWEAGVERKDGLRAIECAIFRNQTRYRSSVLIQEAIAALRTWEHANDVEWPDGIITAVDSQATMAGRAADHDAGWCFRSAGFVDFEHAAGRADTWLRYEGALPEPEQPRPLQASLW